MRTGMIWALLLLATQPGCYTGSAPTDKESGPALATADEKSGKQSADDQNSLAQRTEIAEHKLRQAELEQNSDAQASSAQLARAEIELQLAQAKLTQFVKLDRPNRLARSQLNLVRVKDRAQEAADELAQIEIMYEDAELEDRTAEFVVARGRRNAQRQAEAIKLEEQSLKSLEQHALPLELKQLELNVQKKKDDLAKSRAQTESSQLGKKIGVMNARQALDKLKQEGSKKEQGSDR